MRQQVFAQAPKPSGCDPELNTTAAAKFVDSDSELTAENVSLRRSATAHLLAARLLPWSPAVVLAAGIYLFAVNVPYGQEWNWIPLVLRLQDGNLSWAQFLSDPAIVAGGVVVAPLAVATHFNAKAQMYTGFGLHVLAFIFLWSVLELTLRAWHRRLIAPLSIIFALLMFSPAHGETWSTGLTAVRWGMMNLTVALTVWLLARWSTSFFAIAAGFVLTWIGTVGLPNGAALWGVVSMAIFTRTAVERKASFSHLVMWVLGMLALGVAYFSGLGPALRIPQTSVLLTHPLRLCGLTLVCLGWPLTQSANLWFSGGVGLAGLVVFAVAAWNARQDPLDMRAVLPWLWLPGYALLAAVLTAARLLDGGTELVFAEGRSIASFFWIGFAVTTTVAVSKSSEQGTVTGWRRAALVAITAVAVNCAWCYQDGYSAFVQDSRSRQVGLKALYQASQAVDDSALELLYSDKDQLLKYTRALEDRGVGPFSPRMSEERRRLLNGIIPATKIAVGEGFLDATDCDHIGGWAWDRQQPHTPIKIDIYVDGARLGTTYANRFRWDLLDAHIGNGRHSFMFKTPSTLKDGRTYTITARISGTAKDLYASPRHVSCH
jgi:hypothetical protein